MRSFNRGTRSTGRREFSRENRNVDRPMYKAVCSNCGKQCEVPFRPTGSKPVLCRDCFQANGGPADARRSASGNDFRRSGGSDRPMYDALCNICGDACKVPFEPVAGKPIYCSRCYEKKSNGGEVRRFDRPSTPAVPAPSYKEQFEALHKKLDSILSILNSAIPSPLAVEEVEKEAPIVEKKRKASKKKKEVVVAPSPESQTLSVEESTPVTE